MVRKADETMQNVEEVVGARVRSMRLRNGLSLRSAADKIGDGVHFTTLGKIERGQIKVDQSWAQRFATAYGGKVSEILVGDFEKDGSKEVPVFLLTDYLQNNDRTKLNPVAWVPAPFGGANCFSIYYLPPVSMFPKRLKAYLIVDPDWKKLSSTNYYLLALENGEGVVGVYDREEAQFQLFAEANGINSVRVGHDRFIVVGRVIFTGIRL